ncbi:MAG: hydroxyacid dehydrogenase [Clostridia bacterium]|nr:hydroxyacid dehydrogenase [Clostridia bacterium]
MNTIITGAFQASNEVLEALRKLDLEITYHLDERQPVDHPEQYEAAICNGLFLYNPIEAFTNLKYIQLTSAGMDRVPLDYIREHGITVHNARGVYSVPMAEFAICGVLQLYKQSRFFAENQRTHRWEKHRELLELCGKTVCIVGCGSVGTECAKRFAAFGCHVTGVDIHVRDDAAYAEICPMDVLDTCLAAADVVVLTLPLTADTYHIIGRDALMKMKPGAILVNIGRGAIVDTAALIKALSTHLGGAVLDVFEAEPLDDASPLWDMENVILTPHNSFVGEGNHVRLMHAVLKNLRRYSME